MNPFLALKALSFVGTGLKAVKGVGKAATKVVRRGKKKKEKKEEASTDCKEAAPTRPRMPRPPAPPMAPRPPRPPPHRMMPSRPPTPPMMPPRPPEPPEMPWRSPEPPMIPPRPPGPPMAPRPRRPPGPPTSIHPKMQDVLPGKGKGKYSKRGEGKKQLERGYGYGERGGEMAMVQRGRQRRCPTSSISSESSESLRQRRRTMDRRLLRSVRSFEEAYRVYDSLLQTTLDDIAKRTVSADAYRTSLYPNGCSYPLLSTFSQCPYTAPQCQYPYIDYHERLPFVPTHPIDFFTLYDLFHDQGQSFGALAHPYPFPKNSIPGDCLNCSLYHATGHYPPPWM